MSALAQTNGQALASREVSTALAEISRPAPEPRGERIELPESKLREAAERYAVIWPLVEFMKLPASRRVKATGDGRWLRTPEALVEYLATQEFSFHTAEHGLIKKRVSVHSIWRWYRRFRAAEKKFGNGKLGLARPVRSDEGTPRIFTLNPNAAAFIEAQYLHHKSKNFSMIHELLLSNWKSLRSSVTYTDSNGKVHKNRAPGFNTTRRWLSKLSKPLVTLAQEGPSAWYSKCSAPILREAPPVMAWWVCDHRELDMFVRNTIFDEIDHQKQITLWVTLVIDWGSRKVLGYAFGPTPSSHTIGAAFSIAAFTAGAIAPNLHWDRGRDFKRFGRIMRAPELEGILTSEITQARPYNARAKIIEGHFAIWSQRFDPGWRPAWRGRKPSECPEDCREAQKQHKEFLAGKRTDSPLPSDEDVIFGALEWIAVYNATPQEGLDGRSPNEAFDAGHPLDQRGQVDLCKLAVLFGQREERVVRAGGCVELLKRRYEPTNESLKLMGDLQGETVIVKYDPYNLEFVLALHAGRIVGRLRRQKSLTQSAHGRESVDGIRAAARRNSNLLRPLRDKLQSLARRSREMGWKSPGAELSERGRARFALPAAQLAPAVASAAPGAGSGFEPPEASPPREGAPAFVSDAVAQHGAIFDHIELEDEDAPAS